MLGLATAAKFAPVVLVPLFATGTGEEREGALVAGVRGRLHGRSWPCRSLLYLPAGGLREFYDATIGYQMDPHSVL